MVGPISVLNARELQATLYAIKSAPTEIRKQIRQQTRSMARPEWTDAIKTHARTAPHPLLAERTIARTAKITVSDQQVRVRAAGTRRKVTSGGLIPLEYGRAVEFGSGGHKTRTYQSKRKGRTFTVRNRHVNRQLTPRRQRGTTFWPAANDMQPRLLALWVQTTVRTILDALDGKR